MLIFNTRFKNILFFNIFTKGLRISLFLCTLNFFFLTYRKNFLKSEAGLVLNLFLNFGQIWAWCSYKLGSYKKKCVYHGPFVFVSKNVDLPFLRSQRVNVHLICFLENKNTCFKEQIIISSILFYVCGCLYYTNF